MIMSPLTVRITRKGQICTLAVSGELDIATTHVLARRAAEALRLPTERLIIDLSGLQFIDVCGARGLADVTRAAPPGYPVLVRGAAGPVRRILDLLALPLEQSGAVTPDSAERPGPGIPSAQLLAPGDPHQQPSNLRQRHGPGRPSLSGPRPLGHHTQIPPAHRRQAGTTHQAPAMKAMPAGGQPQPLCPRPLAGTRMPCTARS